MPRNILGLHSGAHAANSAIHPIPIMQKTNKAVRKRFKISARGKILRQRAGRRHLAGSKKAKKSRAHRRAVEVHFTDAQRVTKNLPFGG